MNPSKYKSLSKKQLQGVVADYAAMFPGWDIVADGLGFARESGPIRQMIWFQKLTYAAYRPTHVINTTVLSMPRMLHQLLDTRHREIEYGLHESRWRSVLVAMEQQFKPDVRKPLEVAEVLSLCEAEARHNVTNDLTMLAVLYAWLGRDAEALEVCARMQTTQLPTTAPVPEWEDQLKAFGRALASAIEHAAARTFIDETIEKLKAQ